MPWIKAFFGYWGWALRQSVPFLEKSERASQWIEYLISLLMAISAHLPFRFFSDNQVAASPLWILPAMFLIRAVFFAPVAMWSENQDHKRVQVSIFYDPTDPNCWRATDDRRFEIPVWRLGIRGPTGTSIQNAFVEIDEITPHIDDVRRPLHPMRSQEHDGKGHFSIPRGDVVYVDLFRYWNSENELCIVFDGTNEKAINAKSFEFYVSVKGDEFSRAGARFQFETNSPGKPPANWLTLKS